MTEYTHKTMVLTGILPDELRNFRRDAGILIEDRATMSEIVPGTVNGLCTFFIAPSGSKDDWPEQHDHTRAIKAVANLLSDTVISVNAIILTFSDDGRVVTTEVVKNYFDLHEDY